MNIEIADIKDYEREQAERKLLMKLQIAERTVKDDEGWLELEKIKALMEKSLVKAEN